MQYVGLDVHKTSCQACVEDENGNVLLEEKIPSTKEELNRFFSQFDEAEVVLESTILWEYVYETIEEMGFKVVLAHPLKTKAIAAAKVKTDKIDAKILADLLRADLVPESYVPTKEIRDLRNLVRERRYLVNLSTGLKNRIHSELTRKGLRRPGGANLFTDGNRRWLRSLDIVNIDIDLNVIEFVRTQIKDVEKILHQEFMKNADARLLTSIPGIGETIALTIIAELGDIERFRGAGSACSFAGVVPTVRCSASTEHYGPISKEGSKGLRWALIEAALFHIRFAPDSRLTRFYRNLSKRKDHGTAIVATARKLLVVIYWMLKMNEPYHAQGFDPVF